MATIFPGSLLRIPKAGIFLPAFFCTLQSQAQDVMKVMPGARITIQPGTEIVVLGGVSFDKGAYLVNNGTIRIKDNDAKREANWTDATVSSYHYGSGRVIFNGNSHVVRTGNSFERIDIDAVSNVDLASDIAAKSLYLVHGKINTTTSYKVIILDKEMLSLDAAALNPGFSVSWINGNLRRYVSPLTKDKYIFPVGDETRVNMAIVSDLAAKPFNGLEYIDASFSSKPLNENIEEIRQDFLVNPGGVWTLSPNSEPLSGSCNLQLYYNGFAGITGRTMILKRSFTNNKSKWTSPSLALATEGDRVPPREYAENKISSFGQFAIGYSRIAKEKPCSQVSVSLYPNPSTGQFTIQLTGTRGIHDIFITDMGGKLVKQIQFSNTSSIDVTGLSAGIYLVGIPAVLENGGSYIQKLVINK
jgi:hypothetical protein